MLERVQKIISARGVMSRRAAETAIEQGRVSVNGVTAVLGDKADGGSDLIELDGRPLRQADGLIYVMLNKPRGVVSTMSDERGRRTVASLVTGAGARLLPVGRLDMDSEGLLLMTNDHELIHKLTHPSHQIDKIYHVSVKKPAGSDMSEVSRSLSGPLVIEGRPIAPAKVRCLIDGAERLKLSVAIHEGRKRQVRNMCAAVGLTVLRLSRVAVGPVELGALKPGAWRYLTPDEVRALKNMK